jgi:quercetin dioxygenase-like cupin family protein
MNDSLDLLSGDGAGAIRAITSEDLNVNLVSWPAGGGVGEHVNDERDVLLVVVRGAMTLRVDGVSRDVSVDHAIVVPKGSTRSIVAGADGVRYVSAHRRRAPLDIARPA